MATRVQELQAEVEEQKALLYFNHSGGPKPRYAPEIHAQKLAKIEEHFTQGLEQIMEDEQAKVGEIQEELTRISNPYTWLNATEMAQAKDMAEFIREDIERQEIDDLSKSLVETMKQENRIQQWLVLRYASQRYDSIPNIDPLQDYKFREVFDELRKMVVPKEVSKVEESATDRLRKAQNGYNEALYTHPDERKRVADSLGVGLTHFPDMGELYRPVD